MIYNLSDNTWSNREMETAHKVIDSGKLTMGEYVKKYEIEFAEKFGSKYAIMSNSGSSANLLAAAALVYSGKLRKGDEVLVTAVSWSTTYFPLVQMGLKIRFVDIDLHTLNVDCDKLKSAVTESTRAVMAVNLLGNPNDYNKILELCRENNLLLIEDNCESMGAELNGKKTGTFGILGTFSSYFSHHICTMEGGMTVTDDEELYHYMLAIRSHGWTRHLPTDSDLYKKSEDSFYESFHFIMPGYNLRPIELEAAVGIEQINRLDEFIAQRRKNAEYFKYKISDKKEFYTQQEVGSSSWFGFAIILSEEMKGKRPLYIKAFKESKIEVRPIVAGNFARQEALQYIDFSISGKLTNADYIHENGFFVGNHSVDMKEKLEYLIAVLESIH